MFIDLKETVSDVAGDLLKGKDRLKVLEAGCGSSSHVRLPGTVHAVGIDISAEQLAKNTAVQEKILGDIQQYRLPRGEFDVTVCWMVLEHLSNPGDALLNLFASVKPEGLVILGFPNLLSFKGMITKMTPFWFHRLFYRIMRYKSHPFPTYLRRTIVPNRVRRLAEENGFVVVLCELVEGGTAQKFKSRFRVAALAFSAADSVIRLISGGRANSLQLDNCAMVLQKRPVHS